MPIAIAHEKILQLVQPVQEIQIVKIVDAIDRIVAQDIISPIDVPGFDNSAMDGYAIKHADLATSKSLQLVGKSFAGTSFEGKMSSGQCVRIMTGAEIPEYADTVVMQENVKANGNEIEFLQLAKLGDNIRRQGSDIKKGQVVLPKGSKITPVDIGLLASLGLSEIHVFRRLKIAVFSTGDELVASGNVLPKGHIFDTNRPMLIAMIKRLGFEAVDLGIIKDDKQAIRATFEQADQIADCIITSGGVSVGEADFTKEVLQELGQIAFWKLAIKPGKPLAFGQLPNSIFFGLPGNPVSSAVTMDKVAMPALCQMSGQSIDKPFLLTAIAAQKFRKRPGRTDFQRAFCYRDDNGQLMVTSAVSQSSGILSSFRQSNCFAVIDQEAGDIEAGASVQIQLFSSPLI